MSCIANSKVDKNYNNIIKFPYYRESIEIIFVNLQN